MIVSQKIYDNFFIIDPKDYKGMIKYYEENYLYLNNKSKFVDNDDFIKYILILAQYVISLENTG